MGTSKIYWTDLLKSIYQVAGNGDFTWSELQARGISKSELSRLKCSNYLIKNKNSKQGAVKWRLNPEAVDMLSQNLFVKKKGMKKRN